MIENSATKPTTEGTGHLSSLIQDNAAMGLSFYSKYVTKKGHYESAYIKYDVSGLLHILLVLRHNS